MLNGRIERCDGACSVFALRDHKGQTFEMQIQYGTDCIIGSISANDDDEMFYSKISEWGGNPR